jgi:Domain of unknown function (DUF6362)
MIGQHWDQEAVASRLEEAVDVLARLPEARVRGVYDLWPKLVGEPCRHARPAAAAPEAIDRVDEALGWLMWLEPEERRLVWLRAEGVPGSGSRTGSGSGERRHGSAGPRLCSRSRSA